MTCDRARVRERKKWYVAKKVINCSRVSSFFMKKKKKREKRHSFLLFRSNTIVSLHQKLLLFFIHYCHYISLFYLTTFTYLHRATSFHSSLLNLNFGIQNGEKKSALQGKKKTKQELIRWHWSNFVCLQLENGNKFRFPVQLRNWSPSYDIIIFVKTKKHAIKSFTIPFYCAHSFSLFPTVVLRPVTTSYT